MVKNPSVMTFMTGEDRCMDSICRGPHRYRYRVQVFTGECAVVLLSADVLSVGIKQNVT